MDNLKKEHEKPRANKSEKLEFTPTETENFKKAFDDPEFLKMFTEYMDEMQDPKNRQETEEYISQLESDKKVPQGKELVRPKACFVAKTCKMVNGAKGDKVFINIVSSESVMKPSKTASAEGETWSLPYSIGPPHMEKDNNDSNVVCFDCCYHPIAVAQMDKVKKFRDSLVHTAIEGVEEAYRAQKQETKMSLDYHVLKGVSYKNGLIPAMLVDTASKNRKWNNNSTDKNKNAEKNNISDQKGEVKKVTTKNLQKENESIGSIQRTTDEKNDNQNNVKKEPVQSIKQSTPLPTTSTATAPATTPIPAPVSAIKKGFLTSAKSSIYPESISAKIKPQTNGLKAPPILLPDMSLKNKNKNENENKNERGDNRGVLNLRKLSGMEGTGSRVEELTDAEIRQLTKTGNITKTKHLPVPVPAPVLTPSQSTPALPSNSSANSSSNSSSDGDKEMSLLSSSPSPSPSDSLACNSSASSSSSVGHHSSAGYASFPSSSSAEHPSKAPTYTLLERGIVSMGDFETLKSRNTSTRPSELVCRISVPLVTKASLMVLDVAERQIQFSYLDTYALSIPLPFPVFEKKGTAKYDKLAKTLTVTMPVQPAVTPDTEAVRSIVTVTDNKDNDKDNDKDSSIDDLPKNAGEKKEEVVKKEEKEDTKCSNSRWVGDKGLEMRLKNEELKNEIRIKSLPVHSSHATLSKAEAEAEAVAKESQSSQPAPSSPVPVTASNPSSSGTVTSASASADRCSGDDVDSTFKPCKTFEGQREGYLFKKGALGQGYYLDDSKSSLLLPTPLPSSTHSTLPQSSSPSPSLSTTLQSSSLNYTSKPCPLEFRQTKQAIAVLIQISGILLDSATVSFNEYTVDIEFRALGSGSRIFDDESTHVNPIIASSACVARLTGNNTAINANSILNKTETLDISIKSLSQEKIELTDLYGVRLTSLIRLNKSLCKYDIASRNMVLVLTKDDEGFYEESEGSKVLSSISFKAGDVVTRVLNSVTPEPKLISLKNDNVKKNVDREGVEEKKSEKSKDRTENEKRDSLISDQLSKMKFTTSLNFDLD